MKKYILTFDAGTTGNRAMLFDSSGKVISSVHREMTQYFPKPGYVEHDAKEIWFDSLYCAREAMDRAGVTGKEIAAVGVTNQRETTVVWNKKTGEPICNAIVWQCRRTSDMCDELKKRGLGEMFRQKTGLLPDAYFSVTKLKWILEHVPGAKEQAEAGELLFGTVDTWLVWNLTGGRVHATDYTNASRTMMYNIHSLEWDEEILNLFDIPRGMLPKVLPSGADFGETGEELFGTAIPVAGVAGDQQAALFGQACFRAGDMKNTYGTGAFLLMNTGDKPVVSRHGLLTTLAAGLSERPNYVLEGSVFAAGSAVQWLRDELGFFDNSEDSEYFATRADSTEGCYVVPAFTGLGAPYWNQHCRGMLVGLHRSTNKYHITRATLESVAYQIADLAEAVESDCGLDLVAMRVDGGMSGNNFLMQFQADILGIEVIRTAILETTSLGVAFLAGLTVGIWKDEEEVKRLLDEASVFTPAMSEEDRLRHLDGWHKAIRFCVGYRADEE